MYFMWSQAKFCTIDGVEFDDFIFFKQGCDSAKKLDFYVKITFIFILYVVNELF